MARGPHLSELAAEWHALGAKPQHVRRIFLAWAGLAPWEARKGESFPKAVAEALPDIRERLDRLSHALPVRSAEAETVKLILGLEDGECVESVLLPRQGLCVSTQVGCAVGCVFCMTGKGGLVRQLSSAEIVAQYCEARRVRSDVRKIVLMGMGEPSHNLDAVCEAVEFFGNVCGLAHKDIVVSTVGDHRLFDRLPALSVRPALALSLHTTDNALRRKLLTNSKDIPVETLLERTLDYADETGYPAQIEWTLMAGINDAPEQVERLVDRGTLRDGELHRRQSRRGLGLQEARVGPHAGPHHDPAQTRYRRDPSRQCGSGHRGRLRTAPRTSHRHQEGAGLTVRCFGFRGRLRAAFSSLGIEDGIRLSSQMFCFAGQVLPKEPFACVYAPAPLHGRSR